jgi:hypothetical protein
MVTAKPTCFDDPGKQGVMTREIATNVGQAATGTAEVAANIADVSEGSVQTGAASTQVLQSARSLSGESAHLKAAGEEFLITVRAAQVNETHRLAYMWRESSTAAFLLSNEGSRTP